MRLQHKYRAIRDECDGIKFPSKLEKRYYQKLKLAKRSNDLVMFLRQPLFDLGGGVVHRSDFLEFWSDGTVRVTDCKGFMTKEFIKVKKLVEHLYPVEIEIIKRA